MSSFSNPLNLRAKKCLLINTPHRYTLPVHFVLPLLRPLERGMTFMKTAGVFGGIERMTQMVMASSLRIMTHDRNRNEVDCKSCGIRLPFDWGHAVSWNVYGSRFKPIFLCRACFAPVKDANEAFPPRWKPDQKEFELPPWWKDLDRDPRETRPEYKYVTEKELRERGVIR